MGGGLAGGGAAGGPGRHVARVARVLDVGVVELDLGRRGAVVHHGCGEKGFRY